MQNINAFQRRINPCHSNYGTRAQHPSIA